MEEVGKKLENKGVSNNIFKRKIKKKFNINKIYNYYGLIEQTGSIFFECENGYFVSSIFLKLLLEIKILMCYQIIKRV